MWELFYLGSAVPYGDNKEFEEILDFLLKGHRLSKPPMCPEYIYDLMLDCWFENHSYRPTFKEVKSRLKRVNTSVPEIQSLPILEPVQHNNLMYLDFASQESTAVTAVSNNTQVAVYHKFKETKSNDGEEGTQNVLEEKISFQTSGLSKQRDGEEVLRSCNAITTEDVHEKEYKELPQTSTRYITMPEMISFK